MPYYRIPMITAIKQGLIDFLTFHLFLFLFRSKKEGIWLSSACVNNEWLGSVCYIYGCRGDICVRFWTCLACQSKARSSFSLRGQNILLLFFSYKRWITRRHLFWTIPVKYPMYIPHILCSGLDAVTMWFWFGADRVCVACVSLCAWLYRLYPSACSLNYDSSSVWAQEDLAPKYATDYLSLASLYYLLSVKCSHVRLRLLRKLY